MDERRLSDSDVDAICDAMESRLMTKFYNDIGKGVMSIVIKTVVMGLLGLAAYGSLKGIR